MRRVVSPMAQSKNEDRMSSDFRMVAFADALAKCTSIVTQES